MIRFFSPPAALSHMAPAKPESCAAEMAELLHAALSGWFPASTGAGLEMLFDRMEAGR